MLTAGLEVLGLSLNCKAKGLEIRVESGPVCHLARKPKTDFFQQFPSDSQAD